MRNAWSKKERWRWVDAIPERNVMKHYSSKIRSGFCTIFFILRNESVAVINIGIRYWYNKGSALDNLGKHTYKTYAIECYDQALELEI